MSRWGHSLTFHTLNGRKQWPGCFAGKTNDQRALRSVHWRPRGNFRKLGNRGNKGEQYLKFVFFLLITLLCSRKFTIGRQCIHVISSLLIKLLSHIPFSSVSRPQGPLIFFRFHYFSAKQYSVENLISNFYATIWIDLLLFNTGQNQLLKFILKYFTVSLKESSKFLTKFDPVIF